MTDYQETSADMIKLSHATNVININNYNNTVYNIINASGVIHRPSAKVGVTAEAIDAESVFCERLNSNLDLLASASSKKGVNEISKLEEIPAPASLLNNHKAFQLEIRTQKSPDFLTHQRYQDAHLTVVRGFVTVLTVMVLFVLQAFWMVGAKLIPETGNPIIDFMREDYHYCTVLPLLYPIFYIFTYKNWASLKAFRHN